MWLETIKSGLNFLEVLIHCASVPADRILLPRQSDSEKMPSTTVELCFSESDPLAVFYFYPRKISCVALSSQLSECVANH